MNKKYKPYSGSGGFTIVELLVASAVFSLVLLVALTGFLQIGHLFYKGVSNAQTQDTTRQVVNDISDNLKATPATFAVDTTHLTAGSPYEYVCVGAYRYTFATFTTTASPENGKTVSYKTSQSPNYDPTDPAANMGLIKERVGSGNCPQPCVTNPKDTTVPNVKCGTQLPISTAATELLGNGMRVGDLFLDKASNSPNLYSLAVTLVYGDYSVLDFSTTPPTCTGNSAQQRFCAVNQVSTSVFEGELHP